MCGQPCQLARVVLHITVMETRRPPVPLERMPLADMLSCVEPFTAAREGEIEQLARAATPLRKPAGTVLLREGHLSDGLYIVLRGRVNLVRAGAGGRDLILTSLGPGDVFGEDCVLDGVGASTAAVTAVPTELARLSPEAVLAHLRRDPATMGRLMRLMHQKLRDVESVASGLALCDVEERLKRTLARLARRQGRANGEGWILAPVPTQSELARMVGSCRETVSRTLTSMARNGLLESRGRRMVLGESIMRLS